MSFTLQVIESQQQHRTCTSTCTFSETRYRAFPAVFGLRPAMMMLTSNPSTLRPSRGAVRVQAGNVFTVTLVQPNGKEATFRAGTSKSIYDVASYAGIHLPASCKVGSCSACCSRVLEGRVKQSGQTCIPPELVKQGFIALCCSVPESDVKIMTNQGVEVRRWKADQPLKADAPKARR